jgi:hypothetical protein
MFSPVCDGTRFMLGMIATLGGIVFAAMTNILKNEIKDLYRRIVRTARQKPAAVEQKQKKPFKLFNWLLLVISFLATVFLGSYVAAVPSQTCENIIVSELICHPDGNELDGEYVIVQNLSNRKIDLKDWQLCDYKSVHCYVFGDIAIQPQSSLKVWTRDGTNTSTELYFGEAKPIWNNGEDTAYLYDLKDQLIFQLPCSDK